MSSRSTGPGPESVDNAFADAALAVRLETFAARDHRRFVCAAARVFPGAGADLLEVAGGVAAFCLPGAPFNQAMGLGLAGPVTADDIDALERFFFGHGESVRVNVCPLAHPSLTAELSARHYAVADFENVLVRALGPDDERSREDSLIDIRVVTNEERPLWARLVVRGFSTTGTLTEAEESIARVLTAEEGAIQLLATIDGEPVGTGEVVIEDGIGWLSADTTLPAYRCKGVQTALQLARLRLARLEGCDLAATEARPGSGSQRNMERLGFRIAYTRVDMVQSGGVS